MFSITIRNTASLTTVALVLDVFGGTGIIRDLYSINSLQLICREALTTEAVDSKFGSVAFISGYKSNSA